MPQSPTHPTSPSTSLLPIADNLVFTIEIKPKPQRKSKPKAKGTLELDSDKEEDPNTRLEEEIRRIQLLEARSLEIES